MLERGREVEGRALGTSTLVDGRDPLARAVGGMPRFSARVLSFLRITGLLVSVRGFSPASSPSWCPPELEEGALEVCASTCSCRGSLNVDLPRPMGFNMLLRLG
ncbi:hypothetical protein ASC87_16865 [Rhizobacter sp. Root1221]|nr:hypothetical protein ASC87_16865 [Rhizobacter sp. Root1221]